MRDFVKDICVGYRLVNAQDYNVGRDTKALHLLDGVLGGLALVLTRGFQIWHKRYMNVKPVFLSYLLPHLTDSLQKRLALDVADGAADFRNYNVGVGLFADGVNKALDLVGDVRNHLNSFAEVLALALLCEHIGIDLARGEVGVFVQILVDKTLVMSEVKVCFRAVLGDINLAVLIRAHGAGVNVDVRVKLLRRDLQAARL